MLPAVPLLVLGLSLGIACSSSDDSSSGTGGAPATGGAPTSTGGVPGATGGIAATGGASDGGAPGAGAGGAAAGTPGKPGDGPADTSKAGIAAFLASKGYQSWKFDVDAPRAPGSVSPHGRVRVAINTTLEASIAAGADGEATPFAAGSIAVKELYDAADARLGTAFMWKIGEESTTPNWIYYCDGPPGVCGVSDPTPYYASGNTLSGCNICHGKYFFIGLD